MILMFMWSLGRLNTFRPESVQREAARPEELAGISGHTVDELPAARLDCYAGT